MNNNKKNIYANETSLAIMAILFWIFIFVIIIFLIL